LGYIGASNLLARAKARRKLAALILELAQAMSVSKRPELIEHAARLELEALGLEREAAKATIH
jgi:hypothetical protein